MSAARLARASSAAWRRIGRPVATMINYSRPVLRHRVESSHEITGPADAYAMYCPCRSYTSDMGQHFCSIPVKSLRPVGCQDDPLLTFEQLFSRFDIFRKVKGHPLIPDDANVWLLTEVGEAFFDNFGWLAVYNNECEVYVGDSFNEEMMRVSQKFFCPEFLSQAVGRKFGAELSKQNNYTKLGDFILYLVNKYCPEVILSPEFKDYILGLRNCPRDIARSAEEDLISNAALLSAVNWVSCLFRADLFLRRKAKYWGTVFERSARTKILADIANIVCGENGKTMMDIISEEPMLSYSLLVKLQRRQQSAEQSQQSPQGQQLQQWMQFQQSQQNPFGQQFQHGMQSTYQSQQPQLSPQGQHGERFQQSQQRPYGQRFQHGMQSTNQSQQPQPSPQGQQLQQGTHFREQLQQRTQSEDQRAPPQTGQQSEQGFQSQLQQECQLHFQREFQQYSQKLFEKHFEQYCEQLTDENFQKLFEHRLQQAQKVAEEEEKENADIGDDVVGCQRDLMVHGFDSKFRRFMQQKHKICLRPYTITQLAEYLRWKMRRSMYVLQRQFQEYRDAVGPDILGIRDLLSSHRRGTKYQPILSSVSQDHHRDHQTGSIRRC